jgi:hypothetical protein
MADHPGGINLDYLPACPQAKKAHARPRYHAEPHAGLENLHNVWDDKNRFSMTSQPIVSSIK